MGESDQRRESTSGRLILWFQVQVKKPTHGDVLVGGKHISGPGADRGMIFQQSNLMPWLPVWDNIDMSCGVLDETL